MFKYISVKKQIIEERNKNAVLRSTNAELTANVDYIAMMCGVELEDESEEVCENEQELS